MVRVIKMNYEIHTEKMNYEIHTEKMSGEDELKIVVISDWDL